MRPKGNGLIELVDVKSQDNGFFCMKLVVFLNKERNEQGIIPPELWEMRFNEAKSGSCFYKTICPVYERTRKAHPAQPRQLTFNF